MYNPSYLIKSRHDIYYFRYPLPHKPSSRVTISLQTRCPKEALLLSKVLEYHSIILVEQMDLELMDHAEIKAIMSSYYAEKLDEAKARIDKDGPLPQYMSQYLLTQNKLGHVSEGKLHAIDLTTQAPF